MQLFYTCNNCVSVAHVPTHHAIRPKLVRLAKKLRVELVIADFGTFSGTYVFRCPTTSVLVAFTARAARAIALTK